MSVSSSRVVVPHTAAAESTRAIHHDYLDGAIPVFKRAALNVSQTLKDSAYNALPLPLKQVEAHLSALMGREPLQHQVDARAVLRREGAAAFVSNPIGVTQDAALNIWNAFAENDGSAAARQRAGAAGAELFLFALAPTQLLRSLRPVPHTTTLHAGELGLNLQSVSHVYIKPKSDSLHAHVARYDNVIKLSAFEASAPLLYMYALANRWLSLGRSTPRTANAPAGDLRSLVHQLKRHAAVTGHQNLKIEVALANDRLENIFVRRYANATQLQFRGYHRDPIYAVSIPISEKFAQQVKKEHQAAITQNTIGWHTTALAAHQPMGSFSLLPTDLIASTTTSQDFNSPRP